MQTLAAAEYVGISRERFWQMTPRELAAVLEHRATELELLRRESPPAPRAHPIASAQPGSGGATVSQAVATPAVEPSDGPAAADSTAAKHAAPMLEAPAPDRPTAATQPAELDNGAETKSAAQATAATSREMLKAARNQRLQAAQQRWPRVQIAKKSRVVPFTWIHKAAGVDHHEAYDWKNGKLPDCSSMSESIERILQEQDPPPKPHPD